MDKWILLSYDPSIVSGHCALAVFNVTRFGDPYKMLKTVSVWKDSIAAGSDRHGSARAKSILLWTQNIIKEYGSNAIILTEQLVNMPTYRSNIDYRKIQMIIRANCAIIDAAHIAGISVIEVNPADYKMPKSERFVTVNLFVDWNSLNIYPTEHIVDAIYRGAMFIINQRLQNISN